MKKRKYNTGVILEDDGGKVASNIVHSLLSGSSNSQEEVDGAKNGVCYQMQIFE